MMKEMMKHYGLSGSWLLLAAMTFFSSCSDDDHLSKATDPARMIRWDGKQVGYGHPFDITRYALPMTENSRPFYWNLNAWGREEAKVPVLLMTQLRVVDRGRPDSQFDENAPGTAVLDARLGAPLYEQVCHGVEYVEITDGTRISYPQEETKKMEKNPEI